jgi:hypothetical protein
MSTTPYMCLWVCAGMLNLDMLHYPQADRQLKRLLIEASVTSLLLMYDQ